MDENRRAARRSSHFRAGRAGTVGSETIRARIASISVDETRRDTTRDSACSMNLRPVAASEASRTERKSMRFCRDP